MLPNLCSFGACAVFTLLLFIVVVVFCFLIILLYVHLGTVVHFDVYAFIALNATFNRVQCIYVVWLMFSETVVVAPTVPDRVYIYTCDRCCLLDFLLYVLEYIYLFIFNYFFRVCGYLGILPRFFSSSQ